MRHQNMPPKQLAATNQNLTSALRRMPKPRINSRMESLATVAGRLPSSSPWLTLEDEILDFVTEDWTEEEYQDGTSEAETAALVELLLDLIVMLEEDRASREVIA